MNSAFRENLCKQNIQNMLCACSDRVGIVWEDADPVDSLIDRVAASRALAPRDVGFALDLIAYGEYGIALELVCTQIDEHDSLGCRACLGQL